MKESFTGQAVHVTGVCMHWTNGTGLGSCIPTLVGSVLKETGRTARVMGKSTTGKMATTTLAYENEAQGEGKFLHEDSWHVHIMCRLKKFHD